MKDSLLQCIINAIQEKKGKNLLIIDLRSINNGIADYFVICHGDSNTQVEAITGSIEKQVKTNHNLRSLHTEGMANTQWVLLDYGYIIVHVFIKEARAFYGLEELWADAGIERIENNY